MIRLNKMILKEDLFRLMNDVSIQKVSLHTSKNRTLTDDKVCRVFLYLRHPNLKSEIGSIFANLKKYEIIPLGIGDNSFIKGIISQRNFGWLSASHIKKLREIEKRNNIKFGISKNTIKLIEHYNSILKKK